MSDDIPPDDGAPKIVSLQSPSRVAPTPADNSALIEALEDILKSARAGECGGFVFAAVTPDNRGMVIDWLGTPGVSMTELVGLTECLKADIMLKMRGL